MKKKTKYKSRKQILRMEKMRFILLAAVFVLICLFAAAISVFSANGCSTQTATNSTTIADELKMNNLENQTKTIGDDIEIVPEVFLNQKELEKDGTQTEYRVEFELTGTLPKFLNFNTNTGVIFGTCAGVLPVTSFHIIALYYENKTTKTRYETKSNEFTIEIIKPISELKLSEIKNTICFIEDEVNISPRVFLSEVEQEKNNPGTDYRIEFELVGTLPSFLHFDNNDGEISGTCTDTFYSQNFYILALYYEDKTQIECWKAVSNEFSIEILGNENDLVIGSLPNTSKLIGENISIEPEVFLYEQEVEKDNPDTEYKVEFELIGTLPEFLRFSPSTGEISGNCSDIFYAQTYRIVALYYKEKNKKECLKVSSNEFTLEVFGQSNDLVIGEIEDTSKTVGQELNITPQVFLYGEELVTNDSTTKYKVEFELTGTLPEFLHFDFSTGIINGNCTDTFYSQSFSITVLYYKDKTKKECWKAKSNSFILEVSTFSPPLAVAKIQDAIAQVNDDVNITPVVSLYNTNLIANNPSTEYKLEFELEGELPNFLIFDSNTGKISGHCTETIYQKNLRIVVSYYKDKTKSECLKSKSNLFTLQVEWQQGNELAFSNIDDVVKNVWENINFTPRVSLYNNYLVANSSTTAYKLEFKLVGTLPSFLTFETGTGRIFGQCTEEFYKQTYSIEVLYYKDKTKKECLKTTSNEFTIEVIYTSDAFRFAYSLNDIHTVVGSEVSENVDVLLYGSILSKNNENTFYKLEFELIGSLPSGLIFNKNTGMITGKSSEIFQIKTFQILAIYYADKTKKECLKAISELFTVEIDGLEFANVIEDVYTFYDDEQITTTLPIITRGGNPNSAAYSLAVGDKENILTADNGLSNIISGLSFSSSGQIIGKCWTLTPEPIEFYIIAKFGSLTAVSNKFKVFVAPNPKKTVLLTAMLPKDIMLEKNKTYTESQIISPGVSLSGINKTEYNVSYTLDKESQLSNIGLFFNSSNGRLYGTPTETNNYTLLLRIFINGNYTANISYSFYLTIK